MELKILAATVVLGLLQLLIATQCATQQRGVRWNLGNRDTNSPLTGVAARLDRAFKNFLETFPFFIAAVLVTTQMKSSTPTSSLGAQLYFYARAVYVIVYALGIPILRTLIWGVSVAGIAMVLSAAFF